jgi:ParB/RepB/Spo0J family partition protein
MKEKIEYVIKYDPNIKDISINEIETNPLNPRQRFVEQEEDELLESIISKGILDPIIVFKQKKSNRYTILDGQRRYKACKKLNIQRIPAHVLLEEPSDIENLSIMFHIHNVREEWTDFAIAISLKRIVDELGKKIAELKSSDIKDLSKITSLSDYKVNKYLAFLDYPKEVIDRFLESEKKDIPEKGVDPDILLEMYNPIKEITKQMPEILNKYPVGKIIDACIKKKANNIIETNKEFRLLSKALTASRKGEIRKDVLKDKIIDFISILETSPTKVYEETAATLYQIKLIIKNAEFLYRGIQNLNLHGLTKTERNDLVLKARKLANIINEKILSIKTE